LQWGEYKFSGALSQMKAVQCVNMFTVLQRIKIK